MNHKQIARISKRGEPIPKKILKHLIFLNVFKSVPMPIIEEFMKWELVYKSPYSNSFYSKPKTWDHTHHETIRFANHWNFTTRNKMHCKTDTPILENTWAKGIYDEKTDTFKILQIYEATEKQIKYDLYRQQLSKERKEYYSTKEAEDKIEYGRKFHHAVLDGKVKFYNTEFNEGAVVKQWKMSSRVKPTMKILKGEEEIKLDKIECRDYIKNRKVFWVSVNGEMIEGKEILHNLNIRYWIQ